MKARASYQANRKAVGVEFKDDGDGYSTMEYTPKVILRDAKVQTIQGQREGCAGTGVLGYFIGETRQDQDNVSIPFDKAEGVSWDGYAFRASDGTEVHSAMEVYIFGKAILAIGINRINAGTFDNYAGTFVNYTPVG